MTRRPPLQQLVLSIDLDFFVTPIAYHTDDIERPSEDDYSVDGHHVVRTFLETQCGLKSGPVRGAVVTHNDEAFLVLRKEIERGRITPPFALIHVDAHSDLGMGDDGYVFILTELLNRPVSQRASGFPKKSLTFGNWIAFVIANRWITSFTFVKHPDYSNDLPWMYFKDADVASSVIQMRPRSTAEIKEYLSGNGPEVFASGSTAEPPVRFYSVPRSAFRMRHRPDLVLVSQSPGYTPRTADTLLGVIQAYLGG